MGAYRRLLDKEIKDDCDRSNWHKRRQTVAARAPNTLSPDRDQVQYLRAQLDHRDAQLEQVRSE